MDGPFQIYVFRIDPARPTVFPLLMRWTANDDEIVHKLSHTPRSSEIGCFHAGCTGFTGRRANNPPLYDRAINAEHGTTGIFRELHTVLVTRNTRGFTTCSFSNKPFYENSISLNIWRLRIWKLQQFVSPTTFTQILGDIVSGRIVEIDLNVDAISPNRLKLFNDVFSVHLKIYFCLIL